MPATTKPITLYTAGTPNGFQVSVLLEELKAVNPTFDYECVRLLTDQEARPDL